MVLQVNSLKKVFTSSSWFGKKEFFTAVNGISFAIKQGEIVGLLGPNGAGKTTTIHMLLDILTPTSGTISYFNQDFVTHRSEILNQVTFASAYTKLPAKLTIQENLQVITSLYNVNPKERSDRIAHFLKKFEIWSIRHKLTGELSAGQMTRVMLAKAFIPHPKIVLLDEPTASLDPDIAQEVRAFVLEQKKQQGLSVLFTSHNMDEVTQVCDRVLVLQKGSIIADNSPFQLAASVSKVHVHLLITHGLDAALNFLTAQNIAYKLLEHSLEIEIDEHGIAQLLNEFAKHAIQYSQISINKPSLEDYFMRIVQQNKELV